MEAHMPTLPWVASDCKRLLGHRFERLLAEAGLEVLIGKVAKNKAQLGQSSMQNPMLS
jgi:hypothetical protein